MEAFGDEVEFSKVACLLGELEGNPIKQDEWEGYHPDVYGRSLSKATKDEMVAKLCRKLQGIDVTKCSLEMQIWWRDHRKADEKRVLDEIKSKKTESLKKAALAKLTDYEKQLLGLH